MVDYDLMYDYMQVMTSIEEDIQAFNDYKWIDDRTRVITWSMTVYNIHYDLWIALDFILQIPTTGRAVPTVYSRCRYCTVSLVPQRYILAVDNSAGANGILFV